MNERYKIVTSFHPMHLETAVNSLINNGWVVVGGVVAVTHSYDSVTWAQAMTRTIKPGVDFPL